MLTKSDFFESIVALTDQKILAHLAAANHTIEQQTKVLDNQRELIEELQKLRPDRAIDVKKHRRVKFARNKNWGQSAWLGLRESIWFAPINFLEIVGVKLAGLLVGVVIVAGSLAIWILARPVLLVFGFSGYLIENPKEMK